MWAQALTNTIIEMKFAYVVLHYKTLDLTIDCVRHLSAVSPSSHIVVVDNGSGDGSGEALQSLYQSADNIHVIPGRTNLGFAGGNNLGYSYVRDNLGACSVVVMNNDVMISQPDFESRIYDFMSANGVDVCGPDILTPDGTHQNPLLPKPFSSFRIMKQMAIDSARLLCLRLGIFQKRILATYTSVSSSYHRQDVTSADVHGCVPHGACLVFSSRYLSEMPYAFEPVTFLYGEEMILSELCRYRGYRIGICASAQVTHLGGKSTMVDVPQRERQIFKIRMTLRSMWSLLKLRTIKNYVFLRNNNV